MTRQDKIESIADYVPSLNLYELPHDWIDVLYDMASAIQDPSMPTWFRVTTETWFTMLEQGIIDVMDDKRGVQAMVDRNAEFNGDMVGRWNDD